MSKLFCLKLGKTFEFCCFYLRASLAAFSSVIVFIFFDSIGATYWVKTFDCDDAKCFGCTIFFEDIKKALCSLISLLTFVPIIENWFEFLFRPVTFLEATGSLNYLRPPGRTEFDSFLKFTLAELILWGLLFLACSISSIACVFFGLISGPAFEKLKTFEVFFCDCFIGTFPSLMVLPYSSLRIAPPKDF